MCSKLKKPSTADAQALKSLFPSSAALKRPSTSFDPSDATITQQKKKRRAIRFKSSKVTVLAVDSTKGVPKGKYRKELNKNGRVQIIEIKRNYSALEIRNEIIRAFNFTDYKLLSCTLDGKFTYATSHLPTGDELIEGITKRKFPLYIEEMTKV